VEFFRAALRLIDALETSGHSWELIDQESVDFADNEYQRMEAERRDEEAR
jgi:hypothetical protein